MNFRRQKDEKCNRIRASALVALLVVLGPRKVDVPHVVVFEQRRHVELNLQCVLIQSELQIWQ